MRRSTLLSALVGTGLVLSAAPAATATAVDTTSTPVVTVDHVALTADGGDVSVVPPASVSADGKVVMWTSYADVTVPGAGRQTYVTDRRTGAVTMLTAAEDGTPSNGAHVLTAAALAADGRTAAFSDATASNLSAAGGNPLSQVFVRNLRTGSVASARLPLVSTSTGQVRPNVEGLQLSGDGRFLTVRAGAIRTSPTTWGGALRYDTGARTWSVVCGGDTLETRCVPEDSSRDGRYVELAVLSATPTRVVRDLTTGVDTPVPMDDPAKVPVSCLFSGDSSRLVCQTPQPGSSTFVTRSVPDLAAVGTSHVPDVLRLVGVSAHADTLALTTAVHAGRTKIAAARLDVASGTVVPVAVLPTGDVTPQTSEAEGITDAGQVLFTSINRRLGGGGKDVQGYSLFLATIR